MLRTAFVLAMSLLLAGCWVSKQPLFDSDDWAKLDLAGEYELETLFASDDARRVTVISRDDGLFQFTVQRSGDEPSGPVGFVPIPGGSGSYFLAVEHSESDDEYDYYLVRHTEDDGLVTYYPNCAGTSAREGLVIEESGKGGTVCSFSSKEALLSAALEAEKFLSVPHIIAVAPIQSLHRINDADE